MKYLSHENEKSSKDIFTQTHLMLLTISTTLFINKKYNHLIDYYNIGIKSYINSSTNTISNEFMKRLKDITKQMNSLIKIQSFSNDIIHFYDKLFKILLKKYQLDDNIVVLSDLIDIFDDYVILTQFNPNNNNMTQLLLEKNQNCKYDENDNKGRILSFTNNLILYCLV